MWQKKRERDDDDEKLFEECRKICAKKNKMKVRVSFYTINI